MKFTLEIDSRNAALCGGGRSEVARLLHKAAGQILEGSDGAGLVDHNGNKCGEYSCDDERLDFENCEAADLLKFADDYSITLDDDPRDLSRNDLIAGLESIGVACYVEESDNTLAEAYGDSMLADDLPGNCSSWRDDCAEAWNS